MKTYPHFYHNLFTSAGGGLDREREQFVEAVTIEFSQIPKPARTRCHPDEHETLAGGRPGPGTPRPVS